MPSSFFDLRSRQSFKLDVRRPLKSEKSAHFNLANTCIKWGGIVISSYEVSEVPKSGFADEDGMGISSCLLDVVLSQML